jgi:hypothetical protein
MLKISESRGLSTISVILTILLILLAGGIFGFIFIGRNIDPVDNSECPEETLISVINYECTQNQLILTFQNSGKFTIGGYLIYAATSPEQGIANSDISMNITEPQTRIYPLGIRFGKDKTYENSFNINQTETEIYNLTGVYPIYSVEIIPIRWQKYNNKNVLVSCIDSVIKQNISCS